MTLWRMSHRTRSASRCTALHATWVAGTGRRHLQHLDRGHFATSVHRRFSAARRPLSRTAPLRAAVDRNLQGLTDMVTCKNRLEGRDLPSDPRHSDREASGASPDSASLRLLRLPQVMDMTGLRKTKIYALQVEGRFPMRVEITPCCVGWVEQEIQAWISERISARTAPLVTKGNRAPRRGWPRTAIS